MNFRVWRLLVLAIPLIAGMFWTGFSAENSEEAPLLDWQAAVDLETRTTLPPYTEWYILNELRSLRTELQDLRREALQEITNRELAVADRAVRYAGDTVLNVFYIIALGAAFLAIFGWKNFRDVKKGVREVAENRINELSRTYEQRLTIIERELKEKSQDILAAQKDIKNSQQLQHLWQQVGQEIEPLRKIELLDQILEMNPEDIEALTAKLEAVLGVEDWSWALSVANRLLEQQPESGLAFYYRAVAQLEIGEEEAAIQDFEQAFKWSPILKEQIESDGYLTRFSVPAHW